VPKYAYGNDFGSVPISTGDLVLIIQMQDAEINSTNSTNYGSGIVNSFRSERRNWIYKYGNTGVFEYIVTNNVATGGNLTFKGTSAGGGVKIVSIMLNQHQQERNISNYHLNILI
jgi:hypothetical protein